MLLCLVSIKSISQTRFCCLGQAVFSKYYDFFFISRCSKVSFFQKRREEMDRLEKERQAELRSYSGLMVSEKMTSNKQIAAANKSLQELEDDFM